ncbi:MAG: HNH endonuclease [Candidatus Nanoarchaeia archaeon]
MRKKEKAGIGTAILVVLVFAYYYGSLFIKQHPVWSVLIGLVLLGGIVLAIYYAVKRPEIREKEIGFFKFLWESLSAAFREGGREKKKRIPISSDTKAFVYKRANNRCQACGNHGRHIHHIDGNSSNNGRNNLILLCPNCHDDAHTKRIPRSVLKNYAKGSKMKTHTHKYKD